MESDSSLFDPLDYLIHYFETLETDIPSFGHSTVDSFTLQGNMSLNSARSRGHLSVPPFGGSVAGTRAGRSRRGAASLPARPNFHQALPPFVDEGAGDDGVSVTSTLPSVNLPPIPGFAGQRGPGQQQARGAGIQLPPQVIVSGGAGASPGAGYMNRDLFSAAVDVPDDQIQENIGVFTPKTKRGHGRDLKANREAATKSLDEKFGCPHHFISSRDGESDDGNQTKSEWIQNSYASNLAKIEELRVRLVMWDMMRIFMVSTLVAGFDPQTLSSVKDMWSDDCIDMLESWEKITWETACLWQYSINKRCSPEDRTSNTWAYLLIWNSCTLDLKEQVNLKYKHVPELYQGAVTFLWALFSCLFTRSRDTTAALKKYIAFFEKKGLQRIRGESVVVAKRELMAVCKRLDATGDLPDETTLDIIKGMKRCSVKTFRDLFTAYEQEAIKANLEVGDHRPWGHTSVMDEVLWVLQTAVDYFHSLNTTDAWNIPKGSHRLNAGYTGGGGGFTRKCWNCNKEGCHAESCPEPKNQEMINKNKDEYFKKKREREANSGGRGGGRGYDRGGRGGGAGRGRGGGDYTRSKWGTQVRWSGSVPQAYCTKKCGGSVYGWNATHTTSYHAAAMQPGFSVTDLARLSPDHHLVKAARVTVLSDKPAAATASVASSMTGATGGGTFGALSLVDAKAVLTRLTNTTQSEEARVALEGAGLALGLK